MISFYFIVSCCRECEDLEPKGRDTMTTARNMQPTDAPRLHKHEKVKHKSEYDLFVIFRSHELEDQIIFFSYLVSYNKK